MLERQDDAAGVLAALPGPADAAGSQGGGREQVVLTGRRHGTVVGVAAAWAEAFPGAPVHIVVLVGAASRGQGAGRALLLALEASLRRKGWAMEQAQGHGPPAFFASCCAWSAAFEVGSFGPAG